MKSLREKVEIEEKKSDDVLVLKINGAITALTCITVENKISNSIQNGNVKLLLNLAETDYLSSAGLRLLLHTKKKLNDLSGKLVIASAKTPVINTILLAGVDRFLDMVGNEEEGIKMLS